MEDWQLTHIRDNYTGLILKTQVNTSFLAHLQSIHLLTDEERDRILSIKITDGDLASVYQLYRLLVKRPGGYDGLIEVLQYTNQSDAAQILLNHEKYEPKSFLQVDFNIFNTENIFSEISRNLSKKLIVVSTIDAELTKIKIERNFGDVKSINAENVIEPEKVSITQNIYELFQIDKKRGAVCVFVSKASTERQDVTLQKLKCLFINIGKIWEPTLNIQIFVAIELSYLLICECIGEIGGDNISIIEDSFVWRQINPKAWEALLKNGVYDQGRLTSLKSFCNSHYYNSPDQVYDVVCHGKFLVDIIKYEKPPVIYRQTIPVPKSGYIERKIQSRHIVSTNIFLSSIQENVLCVIKSGEIDELKIFLEDFSVKLISASLFTKLTNDGSLKRNSVVLVCNKQEFQNLVFPKQVSAHLLKFTVSKFTWMKTIGNFDFIQKHLCIDTDQDVYLDHDFHSFTQSQDHLILCDSAGMGKSVSLAKMAQDTQKKSKGLVIYFVMPDFIQSVKTKLDSSIGGNDSLLNVLVDVIQLDASEYQISNLLLKNLESSETQVFLFLDGLDEVKEESQKFAFKCLGVFKLFPNVKLRVTVRPHLLIELENCLTTPGYKLVPFDPEAQSEFLMKYWSHDSIVQGKPINRNRLRLFAMHCLESIQYKLSVKEKHIAGVPLQCLLIAEIFEAEAECCANPENTDAFSSELRISSLSELFERMIQKKFLVYERRYLEAHQKFCIDYLIHLHVYLAIKTLYSGSEWPLLLQKHFLKENCFHKLKKVFPNWKTSKEEFCNGSVPYHEILKIGILEHKGYNIKNPDLQFLHRTFAEYLVAKYSAVQIKNSDSDFLVMKFVTEAVLETFEINANRSLRGDEVSQFKFPVVCQFLNIILRSDEDFECNESWVASQCKNWKEISLASVRENCFQILKLFATRISELGSYEQYELFRQVDVLIDLHYFIKRPKYSLAILRVAVERGYLQMMDEVLRKRGVAEKLKNMSELLDVIRVCVRNSAHQSSTVVQVKVHILERLITKAIKPETLPIFAANIHVDILIYVLSYLNFHHIIEMMNAKNKTVLHKTAEYMPAPHFDKLVSYLEQRDKLLVKKLSVCRDRFGQTPLYTMVRHMEPTKSLLIRLSDMVINQTDDTEYNIVWVALRYQQSVDSILSLIEFAKVKRIKLIDEFKRTTMHVAAQHCHNNLLEKLLCSDNLEFLSDINQPDIHGNTSVFYALQNVAPVSIIRTLHVHGAKLDHRNQTGSTLLHLAAEKGNSKVIELLSQLTHVNLFVKNNFGNTPMHLVFLSDTENMLETFRTLEKYSDSLTTRNNKNQCPLLYGLTRKYPEINLDVLKEVIRKSSEFSKSVVVHIGRYLGSLSLGGSLTNSNSVLVQSIQQILSNKLLA